MNYKKNNKLSLLIGKTFTETPQPRRGGLSTRGGANWALVFLRRGCGQEKRTKYIQLRRVIIIGYVHLSNGIKGYLTTYPQPLLIFY